MGALSVVVFNVSGDRRASGGEVVKAVLPGAFLFEGADEPARTGRFARACRERYIASLRSPSGQPSAWLSPLRSGSCVRP